MAKYHFKEWLYGPKNQWPEEPPKTKQKKKERLIYKALQSSANMVLNPTTV